MAALGRRLRKREKVEWSGAAWLKESPRKVLKESRSFYPVRLQNMKMRSALKKNH